MGMHVTDKELQNRIKNYDGCKNCKHQIEPFRMCEWAEHGGDGRVHLICPMWDKTEVRVRTGKVSIRQND